MSEERKDMMTRIPSLRIVSEIRESLIMRVYRLGLALLIPLLAFSILYFWHSGFIVWIALPVAALIILTAGATRYFNSITRAWILAGIMFGCGIFDLLQFGWMSDVRVFFLGSVLVSSLLVNKRAGYSFWGGGIVLTVSYLVSTYVGWIAPFQGNNANIPVWHIIREWLVFAIIGGGLVGTVGFWLTKYATAIGEIRVDREVLRGEREFVSRQIKDLQKRTTELKNREVLLSATASVVKELSALQPVPTLYSKTVDLLVQCFDIEYAGIYLMDESERWMELSAASSELGKGLLAQGYRLPVNESNIVGWAAVHHQSRCNNFENDDTNNNIHSGIDALRAELAIPMLISGDLVGVVDIQSSNPTEFDEFIVMTLERFVLELTVVINSARRIEGVPALELIHPFYTAGLRFASAKSDNVVYASVLEVLSVYKPSRLTFIRKDADSGELLSVMDSINGQSTFVRQSVVDEDNPLLSMVAQYGMSLSEPVWLEKDKLHEIELPDQLYQMILNTRDVYSIGVIPYYLGDKVIGVEVSIYDGPHQFSQVEMRLHRLVAILAALSIERNTLISKAAVHSEHNDILGGIRAQLRSTTDPDVILRRTVQELGHLFDAEMAQVQVTVKEKIETSSG